MSSSKPTNIKRMTFFKRSLQQRDEHKLEHTIKIKELFDEGK